MKRIVIEFIENSDQKYPTCGDYEYDDEGVLQVRVSKLGNDYMEELIAIHELVEEMLARRNGVTVKEITDFDLAYEEERELHLHSLTDEPGFDRRSPYLKFHTYATGVEMGLCSMLDISWNDYNDKVNAL